MLQVNKREFLRRSAQSAAVSGLIGLTRNHPAAMVSGNPSKTVDAASITSLIVDYVAKAPANSIRNSENEKAFDEPLVGFSRGDAPLYRQYKKIIGPYHWTPLEVFKLTFPDVPVKADELTVISWVHPLTESIKADLRKEIKNPSEKWIQ